MDESVLAVVDTDTGSSACTGVVGEEGGAGSAMGGRDDEVEASEQGHLLVV